MTPARRRLVALAAVLAPTRAAALLGRSGDPDAPAAAALAAELTGRPRRTRLAALAAALPAGPPRSSVDLSPLLARLRLEAAASAPRTLVRPAALHPPAEAGQPE